VLTSTVVLLLAQTQVEKLQQDNVSLRNELTVMRVRLLRMGAMPFGDVSCLTLPARTMTKGLARSSSAATAAKPQYLAKVQPCGPAAGRTWTLPIQTSVLKPTVDRAYHHPHNRGH
jgi:hypothetical protein